MVNTQDATLGGHGQRDEDDELPLNGRNYIDLALYQPGVNQDKKPKEPVVHHLQRERGSAALNNFTLDGAILQNSLAGASGPQFW